jgi:alkaline phosphatase D
MRLPAPLLAVLAAAAVVPLPGHQAPPEPERILHRIAFGSCNSPVDATPVWESVNHRRPDAWIWLGDTVYADSPAPEGPTPAARARVALDRLPQLYARQLAQPGYALLRQRARILGTWDDHDYGMNDLGADWIGREEAQQHFLDFYGEPTDSPRRRRPGVYAAYRFGPPGRTIQVILLDTRNRVIAIRTVYRGSLNSAAVSEQLPALSKRCALIAKHLNRAFVQSVLKCGQTSQVSLKQLSIRL